MNTAYLPAVGLNRWQRFIRGLEFDLRVFVIFLGILCLFRAAFILIMRDYIGALATHLDIWRALFYGFRISLKSAGAIGLLTFIICTLPSIVLRKDFFHLRIYICFLCTFLLSCLFFTRIPYYEAFHSTFNHLIFNVVHEDTGALFETVYKQYQLVQRICGAVAVTMVLGFLVWKLMSLQTNLVFPFGFLMRLQNQVLRIILLAGLIVFAIFIRFGGSLTYAYSIHWENSAVTKDHLLNEAILDDLQAVYRAYSQNRHLQRTMALNLTPATIREYGELLSGKSIDGNMISQYLRHEAGGAIIKKPRHIFLIVAESYANWPLWPKYKDLNIANGLKSIIERDESIYVPAFLPAGHGTITSINGLLTGLAEVNLATNYQAESYKGFYETALAPQLRKLGYETHFWYGGFYSWQRLRDFAIAQGFQRFHAANDFSEREGNSWGVIDRILFDSLKSQFSDEQPSFHMILTTCNHPPYTVDIDKDGFDPATVKGLPPKIKLDGEWRAKLGHFWYADKHMAAFIDTMRQKYPDSLFIVTADHSDRMTLENNPDLFTRYSIPFVLHGKGINKKLFSQHVAANHLDILPTLMELIAPKGFVYYSMGQSLTTGKETTANHEFWLSSSAMGRIGTQVTESRMFAKQGVAPDLATIERETNAKKALSWWRIKRGNTF